MKLKFGIFIIVNIILIGIDIFTFVNMMVCNNQYISALWLFATLAIFLGILYLNNNVVYKITEKLF